METIIIWDPLKKTPLELSHMWYNPRTNHQPVVPDITKYLD